MLLRDVVTGLATLPSNGFDEDNLGPGLFKTPARYIDFLIAKWLIKQGVGVTIDAEFTCDHPPLLVRKHTIHEITIKQNRLSILKLLIESGAPTNDRSTLLSINTFTSLEIFEYLFKHGTNPNGCPEGHETLSQHTRLCKPIFDKTCESYSCYNNSYPDLFFDKKLEILLDAEADISNYERLKTLDTFDFQQFYAKYKVKRFAAEKTHFKTEFDPLFDESNLIWILHQFYSKYCVRE